ncbi:response regulator transcription factor [Corynebacterium simulans]|uniref:response regulator transcription factor n=1 Tax=Corynebacterium simulans TaxID=146827 RepID=UPI0030CA9A16
MIRVLLADDQPLLRSALETILNAAGDIQVVAAVGDGQAAVEAAVAHSLDIAILDIRMPGMDGIAAANALLARNASLRVIMLTTFNEEELVRSALLAGVHGFLLKDSDPEVLVGAVRAVHAGEAVLASGVTGTVLEGYRGAIAGRAELTAVQRQGLALVTRRELEVLRLVTAGATNREIAQELVLAETTVKTHVSSLMSKLQARDRVALVLLGQKVLLQ